MGTGLGMEDSENGDKARPEWGQGTGGMGTGMGTEDRNCCDRGWPVGLGTS